MGRAHIPNLITFVRIALSPVFILFFVLGGDWFFAAFAVGLLFEITDFLDGALARRHDLVSGFGKLFDPLADSISRFTVFLCLLSVGYADLFAVALIFYRDALVSSARTVAAYENVIVAARLSGKLKAIFQSIGITAVLVILLINRADIHAAGAHSGWARLVVWVVAVVTAASGVDYIVANWALIRRFAGR